MRPAQIVPKARITALCRLLGMIVFLAAFALPSVRFPPDAHRNSFAGLAANAAIPQPQVSSQQPLTLRGVHCATMGLLFDLVILRSTPQEQHTIPFGVYFAGVGPWANLLVILYLPFSFSERFFKLRFGLTLAILLCLGATVVFFITTSSIPLIGFFVWLFGILLVIFPTAELL